jgi:hypothetical protein
VHGVRVSEVEQLFPARRGPGGSGFASACAHRPPARLVQGSAGHICELISSLLLEETKAEYLGIDDPWYLSRSTVPERVVERVSHTIRALVDRGTRIRHVSTHRGVQADGDGCPSLLCRMGGEVRVVDRLPITACVIDRRLALVPIDLAVLSHGLLIISDPVVVGVLVSVHRSFWLRGHAPSALDAHGAPAHLRAVLTALASGLPDGRAAQRAGLSPRTYSRRVAELVQLLGARSRFEAGVEAVRRGWL